MQNPLFLTKLFALNRSQKGAALFFVKLFEKHLIDYTTTDENNSNAMRNRLHSAYNPQCKINHKRNVVQEMDDIL